MEAAQALRDIRSRTDISQERLAHLLGVSFVSINKWERGSSTPSPDQTQQILRLHEDVHAPAVGGRPYKAKDVVFASRGARGRSRGRMPLFDGLLEHVDIAATPAPPIIERVAQGRFFSLQGEQVLSDILHRHVLASPTADTPPSSGMSAGKNTYTYDAHTYHTKVPPQGIAELVKHYLPRGGLVVDPFAGSGMTGVACRANGYDCVLNELSPAACFIADRFVRSIDPALFEAGVRAVLDRLQPLRESLYTTTCRECGKATEILYTVWSYNVLCPHCDHEFLLWDHCRSYGTRVRDHKILTDIPCPQCHRALKKSTLKRTIAEPVELGYMCCGSRQQEVTHALSSEDLQLVYRLEIKAPVADGFYPRIELPDGINLQQPKRHGLDRVDRFYTPRNLAALSHLWRTVHCIEDADLAAYLAFVCTSLYQRVTRLSEFRFWGGSGNTARYNVPFIFNEANVFLTFARKARSIQDHLETTASHYGGASLVVKNSATQLDYLPDDSVDLIFTDPPFGGNINYSDMNFLWESWLGQFTETATEAIMNKVQGKGIGEYQRLMTQSLKECHRVLRPGHWLLLVFMNSSSHVWDALRAAILEAGFDIRKADIFDKQHGTFKQFVSDNTAGYDLVIHCLKPLHDVQTPGAIGESAHEGARASIHSFLEGTRDLASHTSVYLHVQRETEVDMRNLYSTWMARSIVEGVPLVDFAGFRAIVHEWLSANGHAYGAR